MAYYAQAICRNLLQFINGMDKTDKEDKEDEPDLFEKSEEEEMSDVASEQESDTGDV